MMPSRDTPDRRLFVEMVREEWRLHRRLFAGERFAVFPVVIALMSAGAVWALRAVGTPLDAIVLGLHALVFAFGLYTGSIGLVGRDALRNLLGDVTLVLFSARTLPVSQRRLLVVFLVKDVAFYTMLFLLPLVLAFLPVAITDPGFARRLPLLWFSSTAMFGFGIAVTFAAIALSTRGVSWIAGVTLTAVVGVLWQASVDPLSITPYRVYVAPTSVAALGSLGLTLLLAVVGVATIDPTYSKPARTTSNQFSRWHRALPLDADGLVTKSLLDIGRSGGGFWKVLFSGGVLFAVSAFLVRSVETITGVSPSIGISFGALLGLTAFTTYNWLTQFDSVAEYLTYPIAVPTIFRAKFRAFLLVGVPTAVGYFALAVVLFGDRLLTSLVGAVLVVGLSLYLFGLTVFLTGFDPNELLFDTVLFVLFTAAVSVPFVPILIVGFVIVPVPIGFQAGLIGGGITLGGVGIGLYRRAIPAWETAHGS